MQWNMVLERRSTNLLNVDITRKTLKEIASSAARNKTFGFTAKVGKLPPTPPKIMDPRDGKEKYRYLIKLRIEESKATSPEISKKRFEQVLGVVTKCATNKEWELLSDRGQIESADNVEASLEAPVAPPRTTFQVPVLTHDVYADVFAGIYERDAHVRIVHDSVVNFMMTEKKKRSHVLLHGKPAAAKTTVFERLKDWYEANEGGKVERVSIIDATTMSKAGFESWFLNRASEGTLPEIICLEEIEKNRPEDLLSLLSVMDSRGAMTRMNCRVGHAKAEGKVLVWATCNDLEVLRKFKNGALFSRFQHQMACVRPTRALMHKILLREVSEVPGGRTEWADAAMLFAYDTMTASVGKPLDDPRAIIGLLDGRDRLMDGSYQADQLKIIEAEKEEKSREVA